MAQGSLIRDLELQPVTGETRVSVLDGLRGWAALSVTLSHFLWGVFGSVEPMFRNLVTGLLLNGLFAVLIFFVISGEALSASYWRNPGIGKVAKLAAKRFPRLAIPTFAACLIVFAVINAGLAYNRQAGVILGNAWLGSFPTEPKSLWQLVSFSFFYVFYKPFIDFSLIPFLWTMRTEAIGSILVVLFLTAERYIVYRKTALLVLFAAMAAAGMLSSTFAAGMLFGRLRHEGAMAPIAWLNGWVVATFLVMLMLYPATYMLRDTDPLRYLLVAAPVAAYAIYRSTAAPLLSTATSQFLGRISFPLFLTHYAVIISLTSWLVTVIDGSIYETRIAYGVAAFASVAASFALALLFMPVERFALAASERVWLTFRSFALTVRSAVMPGVSA